MRSKKQRQSQQLRAEIALDPAGQRSGSPASDLGTRTEMHLRRRTV